VHLLWLKAHKTSGVETGDSKFFRKMWAKFRPIWAKFGKNFGKIRAN